MGKPKMMSPAKFLELLPTLTERLTKDLQREQEECALPDLKNDPLWDTPEVDSKTVAKMSSILRANSAICTSRSDCCANRWSNTSISPNTDAVSASVCWPSGPAPLCT